MAGGIAVDDADHHDRHRPRRPSPGRAADGSIDDDERCAVERGRRVAAGHREQLDQLTGMDGTGDASNLTTCAAAATPPRCVRSATAWSSTTACSGPSPTTTTTAGGRRAGAMHLTGPADGPPLLPPRSLLPYLRAVGDVDRRRQRVARPPGRPGHAGPARRARGDRRVSRQGRRSCGGATELVRGADGWVAVSLARPDDVELLPAWLGATDLATGVAGRTADDVVGTAVELGIPCARLGEVDATVPAFHARPLALGPARSSLVGERSSSTCPRCGPGRCAGTS